MKLEESGERNPDDIDAPLVGSIFDDILKQYKSLQNQFVDALITNVSSAFKRATPLYLKKKYVYWVCYHALKFVQKNMEWSTRV
jgi:hypothetical protein